MRRKKEDDEKYILIDKDEKKIELSKFQVALTWLTFLQNYKKELYLYKYDEIIKKSFTTKQWKGYKTWINLIITNKNKSELTYDKLVNKLKREIKKSRQFLGLPEDVYYFTMKIERGAIDKETGLVSTILKVMY